MASLNSPRLDLDAKGMPIVKPILAEIRQQPVDPRVYSPTPIATRGAPSRSPPIRSPTRSPTTSGGIPQSLPIGGNQVKPPMAVAITKSGNVLVNGTRVVPTRSPVSSGGTATRSPVVSGGIEHQHESQSSVAVIKYLQDHQSSVAVMREHQRGHRLLWLEHQLATSSNEW
jgi:hypothetical protein